GSVGEPPRQLGPAVAGRPHAVRRAQGVGLRQGRAALRGRGDDRAEARGAPPARLSRRARAPGATRARAPAARPAGGARAGVSATLAASLAFPGVSRYHRPMPLPPVGAASLLRWAVLILAVVLAAGATAAAGRVPDWSDDVDAAVRDAIGAGHLPGAVVLVGQGDRILYRKAFGLRAVTPREEPMTVDTIFDLASLTKVLATMPVILALADDGRLDLDAPITRYIPELPASVYRDATLRRILLHGAGIPNLPDPRSRAESIAGLLPVILRAGLDFTPGTGFTYSDTGFI